MFRGIRISAGSLLLLGAVSGCGDSAVKEGTVEFKPTDAGQFESMKNQMMEGIKTKSYTKKPAAPKGEDAASKTPEAEPTAK